MQRPAMPGAAALALFSAVLALTPSAAVAQEGRPSRADFSKMAIELPVERVIGHNAVSVPGIPIRSNAEKNERVRPGLIAWHKNVQAAQKASRISGKPILLFQMMGKLDEKFC